MLDFETVNKHLKYNPETGSVTWKISIGNGVRAGMEAGTVLNGYRRVSITGEVCQLHRIAWLLTYGNFPPDQIDHINRVRDDNRLCNLRLADNQSNMKNGSLRKDNISGVMGVNWYKAYKKWRAYVFVSGKHIGLGYYSDWFDAVCARKAADHKYGFSVNHGREI